MRRMILLAFVVLAVAAAEAPCRTWLVTPDGTGDQPSIKAAVYYGADGDTVLLADGTYTGPNNTEVGYRGKSIVIMSQSGDPHSCIIDCQGSESNWSRGFLFYYGEGPGSVLQGVTVKNGYGYEGGGIWCWASSPTISDVILTGNTATSSGGGIYCGGGSSPEIRYVTVFGNASAEGGGLYCVSGSSPTVGNSIVAFNAGGVGVRIEGADCSPAFGCCDIYGNAGGDWSQVILDQLGVNGNISVDPLFCLEENQERPLTVRSSSPCAPGIRLECDGMGAAGVGCWLGIAADVEIEPEVLNPRSRGRWITCYIELGEGHSPDDIDVATVRLNDSIPAEMHPTGVGDHDDDGVADRMVKFSRGAVLSVLAGFGEMELRVSGQVSGTSFAGADSVTVLVGEIKALKMADEPEVGPRHGIAVLGGGVPGGSSEIRFEVLEPGLVTLSIYNVEGRLVRRLVESPMEPNTYVVDWNGLGDNGARVAGGVYFLRLETGNETVTGKAVIVR